MKNETGIFGIIIILLGVWIYIDTKELIYLIFFIIFGLIFIFYKNTENLIERRKDK